MYVCICVKRYMYVCIYVYEYVCVYLSFQIQYHEGFLILCYMIMWH